MSRIPGVLMPVDANNRAVAKFLDLFEYVGGNASGATKYFKYMHPDGTFVITRLSGEGTAMEKMLFFMGHGGSETLNALWGDGTSLETIPFVEYDLLYP